MTRFHDEGPYRDELRRKGAVFFNVEGIEVLHVQALPARALGTLVFHGGRSLAGNQRNHQTVSSWLTRLLVLLLLPARVAVHTPRIAVTAARRNPDYRAAALSSIPWLVVFTTMYGIGQLVGHFVGIGGSKYHLR